LQIFESGDLWSPHPSKEGFGDIEGGGGMLLCLRVEKFIPIAAEGHIATHPEVKTALLVGTGREEAALLVKLVSPQTTLGD
jgi:hypothetical protein